MVGELALIVLHGSPSSHAAASSLRKQAVLINRPANLCDQDPLQHAAELITRLV